MLLCIGEILADMIGEEKNGLTIVRFNDGKSLRFAPIGEKAIQLIKELKERK